MGEARQDDRRQKRAPRPLDAARLDELALHYAARYATTAAKLQRYLARKLRERGWAGEASPDVAGIAARLASLGYVNDRLFAESRTRDMSARGLGRRRVAGALAMAGVDADTSAESLDQASTMAMATAVAFARRKRLGPFARAVAATDPASRQRAAQKAMAAMLRAGHGLDVARRVLAAPDAAAAEALVEGISE
jgi:regulatory protein